MVDEEMLNDNRMLQHAGYLIIMYKLMRSQGIAKPGFSQLWRSNTLYGRTLFALPMLVSRKSGHLKGLNQPKGREVRQRNGCLRLANTQLNHRW